MFDPFRSFLSIFACFVDSVDLYVSSEHIIAMEKFKCCMTLHQPFLKPA